MDNSIKVNVDMLFFALRYALGRQTYAPYTVMNAIKDNIRLLCWNDIRKIITEIENFEGHIADVDKVHWQNFVAALKEEIDEEVLTPRQGGGWNHRIVKFSKDPDEYPIQVLETYYDQDGNPNGFGRLVTLDAEDTKGIAWLCEKVSIALSKPTLLLDENYKVVGEEPSGFPR